MTSNIGQSSDAVLENALIVDRTWERGYTSHGTAKEDDMDPDNDEFWVKRARSSYQSGQTWFDTSVRRRMEDNMRLFNSVHPRGSRYREDAYIKRSRLFRPKTRSGVRKIEAAAAAAFFATQDALTCTPPNPRDKGQKLAADSLAELINYRLQNQIPWFLTCLGAIQDAAKQGVVISKQQWVFREAQEVYDDYIVDAMTGQMTKRGQTIETRIVADHPDIVLRPVENILFSPAADWRNPIQTSPYLIDQEPFYVGDIIEKAADGPKSKYDTAWRALDISVIRSALKQNYDPVRQAREGYREDRYEETRSDIQEHDIVWVHHNYMRVEGQEWYFATLGTELMLSVVPVPLEDVTPLKERPYVLGVATIETHKTYPAGIVELARPIQEEINDIANLRIDNIRHIISPRYFIKRGTSVDIRSLLRNIAGGVTAMENPKTDVEIRQIQDTTASAFKEQATLGVEMDDLIGGFSQSTVMSNQQVTDRVGNTQMMGENANQITEMTIRTFSETWVEPVLGQMAELERALERDGVVVAIIGQRLNIPAEQVFSMLELPVKVTVNVGFGATNPQKRLQKVAMAFKTLAEINPEWIAKADQAAVVTEVMAAVGFKNAERFFPSIIGGDQQDPQVTQLQQENEQLKSMLQGEGQKYQATIEGKKMDGQVRLQLEEMKIGYQREKDMTIKEQAHRVEQGKWNMKMLDISIDREQNEMRKQELVQQRVALNHTIEMDERQYEMAVQESEWQHEQVLQQEDSQPETIKPPAKTNGMGATATGPKTVTGPSAKTVKPKEPTRIASTPKIGNDDMAGVIARGRYGAIPGAEG